MTALLHMSLRITLFLVLFFVSTSSLSETTWQSLTIDNDLFRGSDDGYTNGIFYSWFDTSVDPNKSLQGFWNKPFALTMPNETPRIRASSYTIGQTMVTPRDITESNPDLAEVPYSGILFLSNTYIYVYDGYADKQGSTIGIVGPASLAGDTQKVIHEVLGSTEPEGWGTQLNNEVVFSLSRGRSWQTWRSESDTADMVLSADIRLGTLETSLQTGFMLRYGSNLRSTFASSLLGSSRASNPFSINGGWFIYTAIGAGYTFHQIFFDGNTYTDSRSIDYDRERIGVTTGFAYSWKNWSFTLAVVDGNLLESDETLDSATQFGTFTIGWGG